jgi:chlorobactene glucosyltransferase
MQVDRIVHIAQIVAVSGSLYFLLLSLSNILWLRLSSRPPGPNVRGMVSVLVPARNEERNLARCLDALLDQTHGDYEVIVLDDQSSDGTWRIARRYAEANPGRVRAIAGAPLPGDGWLGKPHAMQQLAREARGEYLLFTDADTIHGPDSIAWAVTNLEAHRADCLSGYVQQDMASLGEQCTVPATYIMSAMILPLWLVSRLRSPTFSFAIGQVIMFRRSAFEAIGGYASVRSTISDDLAIARELKRAGFREVFLDMRRHVRCRMYDGYHASFQGMSKNIYDIIRTRSLLFAAAITLLVGVVLLPLVLLPFQVAAGSAGTLLTLVCVGVFLSSWALVLYDRGLRWWTPFLYPVLFLNLLSMAWWSLGRSASGRGVVWKGRTLH